jgi:hypothetical protein
MTKASFKTLLEEILMVPQGGLAESDDRDSVGNWSSLAEVEILTVIGSELGIDAETFEYETVGDLLSQLEQRGAFTA